MRERTVSPGLGFSNLSRRRHEAGSCGVEDANRPVTGAKMR